MKENTNKNSSVDSRTLRPVNILSNNMKNGIGDIRDIKMSNNSVPLKSGMAPLERLHEFLFVFHCNYGCILLSNLLSRHYFHCFKIYINISFQRHVLTAFLRALLSWSMFIAFALFIYNFYEQIQ